MWDYIINIYLSELLNIKIKESKTNKILNHIYIYNEKPLYILEMYSLKKV